MEDDYHSRFNEAEPSKAVAVTGLVEVPMAGDKFMVFADERTARETAAIRQQKAKALENSSKKAVTLEELFTQADQDKEKILNLIIKGDVQGSVEALKASLEKIQMDDVKVNIIRATVGAITDTDVSLAEASHAIIIGFNVRPMAPVRQEAQTKGVEIRLYNIIYKVIEEIEAACKGLLDPEFEEVVTGQAEVRSVFKISKVGTIAGCYVTDGVIERNSLVRILRDGVVVFEGKMASLRRFKDDVKEVKYGFECGIGIENYNDIKEGDVIEASIMKEIPR
jgi:translation initiation factor IF-2